MDCHKATFLQGTGTAAASVNGNGKVLDVAGRPAVSFEVYGTLSGATTVNFEFQNGSTWLALPVVNQATGVPGSTTTAAGRFAANTVGLQKVRARISGIAGGDTLRVVAHDVCEAGGGNAAGGVVTTAPNGSTTANDPEILTAGGTLAANSARKLWAIQNLDTDPLFILMGPGVVSNTNFHLVLKGGDAADDGKGGFVSDEIWKGAVSYTGTTPRLVVTELT